MNKGKIYTIVFFVLLFSGFYSPGFSQVVNATVDRNKIFIGEQVQLKLSIEHGKAGIAWFSFPDSLNHLEVVKRSKIDTVLSGGYTDYHQTISITSFDSGNWQFPSVSVAGTNQSTPPFTIDVMPVDVSKMQDYNDIKDIEGADIKNSPLITAIIAAVTLFSLGMLYWMCIRKKRAAGARANGKNKLSPLDWALAELNKLPSYNHPTSTEAKKYYVALTGISRTFFSMQLQQHSQQQTTEEWMLRLQPLFIDQQVKTSFFQFLRLSDAVKFAKYIPATGENEVSVGAAKLMFQKVALMDSGIHSPYQPKQS